MYWNQLNDRLREQYGTKVYKLALSSGCSCPNRDGTLGSRGCIFCDGAGAFAASGDIQMQVEEAKMRVASKIGAGAKFIAYFQSFTNTYGDVKIFTHGTLKEMGWTYGQIPYEDLTPYK